MSYKRRYFKERAGLWLVALVLVALASVRALPSQAQTNNIAFVSSNLSGEFSNNPTSLEFGPDDRLYVAQQNGNIYIYTINRIDSTQYNVVDSETIDLIVEETPNHNDDGTSNSTEQRQVTGLMTAGTASQPILYVTSSDWRIAVGNDSGLDTNSGIISRLTCTRNTDGDCEWEKVDIVRGLARSEENHSTNGMDLDPTTNTLFVMSGGHANKGAPGNNFSGTPEYFTSAALLSVDLDQINSMDVYTDPRNGAKYVYDMPTLNDPTRDDIDNTDSNFPYPQGHPLYNAKIDPGDPFGGNNSLNQAIPEPGGPVQIFSPGYRNGYDVVLTENGRLYTSDNGPNGGWGGLPLIYDSSDALKGNESQNGVDFNAGAGDYCTNEFNEDGSAGHGDSLHFVGNASDVANSYYGGHPAPIRAFPKKSGIIVYEEQSGSWNATVTTDFEALLINVSGYFNSSLTIADFPDNPIQCDYQANYNNGNTGPDVRILDSVGASTNGIAEYTASNFGGAMQGNIITASFNEDLNRYELNEAGDDYVFKDNGFLNFDNNPLDVTTQGDGDIFPGTIWAANHGADTITVFEPDDFGTTDCTGDLNDDTIDEDNDGYTNYDEGQNGTNPCSNGSKPSDRDGTQDFGQFLRSDKLDADDDNDGILDEVDVFVLDPNNGLATSLPVYYDFELDDNAPSVPTLFGLGFSGLMSNGTTNYLDQFDPADLNTGGATGDLGIENVTNGDAYQDENTQDNGFQFGVNVDDSSAPFIVHTEVEQPFFAVNGNVNATPTNSQSFGMHIGDGTQDSYLKVVVNANGSAGGIQVTLEKASNDVDDYQYDDADLGVASGGILAASEISLYVQVNPSTLKAQPMVSIDGGNTIVSLGAPLDIPSSWLDAGDNQGMAVGIISTSFDAEPFGATWDFFDVYEGADPTEINLAQIADQTSTEGDDASLTVNAQGGNGDLNYTATGLPGGLSLDAATGEISGTIAADAAVNSPYTVEVTVDDSDNVSDDAQTVSFTWTVDEAPDVQVLYRLNTEQETIPAIDGGLDWTGVGGPDAQSGDGWSVNTGSISTQNVTNLDDSVPDYVPQALFTKERWDPPDGPEMMFSFDVTPGAYTVNLFTGNGYDGTSQVGERVFDINIEDELVEDDLDLVATYGHKVGGMKSYIVNVADNSLDIEFLHVTENPVLNGIEILSLDGDFVAPITIDQLANQLDEEGAEPDLSVVANGGQGNYTYAISGAPAGIEIEDTNGHISGIIATGAAANSPYTVEVTVDDESAETEAATMTFTWTVNEPGTGSDKVVLYRVNNGGEELTVSDGGPNWEADQSVAAANNTASTGTPSPYLVLGSLSADKTFGPTGFTITNDTGVPDLLFAHERYSDAPNPNNMQWAFPATVSGEYEVRLYFAENWFGAASPGVRVFDVNIEGAMFLDDYDPYVEAGNAINVATVETTTVNVIDGTLNIDFVKDVQNPAIKGIEILGPASNPTDTPILVDAIADQTSEEGDQASLGNVVATGGDGQLTYTASGLPDGIDVVEDDGLFAGVIATGAATGGPNNDGVYPVTITVDDSDTNTDDAVTVSFIWTVTAPTIPSGREVLYRVNVGGPELAAADGSEPVWGQDQGNFGTAGNSPYLAANTTGGSIYNGSASSAHPGEIDRSDASLIGDTAVPTALFNIERYDLGSAPEMLWQFPVATSNPVEVRLYFAELFGIVDAVDERVFDVEVEGIVPAAFDDIDQFEIAGPKGAFVLSHQVTITDGTLDLEFIHGVENPALKGIEIVELTTQENTAPELVISPDELNPQVAVGQLFDVAITATDVNGDDLTLSASVSNNGVEADFYELTDNGDGTGTLSVLPTLNDGGETYTVVISALDTESETQKVFYLGVNPAQEDETAVTLMDADFGSLTPGTSATQTLEMTNESGGLQLLNLNPNEIQVTYIELTGPNTGNFTVVESSISPTLPAVLADNESITFEVEFVSNEVGSYQAQANVFYTDENGIGKFATSALTAEVIEVAADPLVCINVGGPAITAFGRDFLADDGGNFTTPYATNAKKYSAPAAVDIPDLDGDEETLFKTERFGGQSESMIFDLGLNSNLNTATADGTLPTGDYLVDLYFIELYQGVQINVGQDVTGARVFDVDLEGNLILDDYDMATLGEPLTPLTVTETAAVTDGSLTITFNASADNGKLGGVCITPTDDTQNQAPVIDPIDDVTFGVLADLTANATLNIINVAIPNGMTVEYEATGLPSGLTIDPQTGEISGIIGEDALINSPHTVEVTVSDVNDSETFDTETFNFNVIDRTIDIVSPVDGSTIQPPQGLLIDWTSEGGDPRVGTFDHIHVYLYESTATDVGGRIGSLPLNGSITIDETTSAIVEGEDTPGYWASLFDVDGNMLPGSYTVELRHAMATHDEYQKTDDSYFFSTASFTVDEVQNQPPIVQNPGTQNNVEGDIVTLAIQATAPETDQTLTYEATDLPGSLTIDPNTGVISGTLDANSTGNQTEGAFIEQGGLVVIEMESADTLPGAWENAATYSDSFSPNINSIDDATGDDFIVWQAGQNLGNPGNGLITYPVQITNPGTYQFKWRTQVGNGTNTTEHNDTWLKIESDVFYAQDGSSILCPKGYNPSENNCTGDAPEGSGGSGWFKVYSSGANNWKWQASTSDNDAHNIYVSFDEPGTYNILVSARSSSHAIDRMVLVDSSQAGNNGQSLSLPESDRVPPQGSTDDGSAGIYTVSVAVTDDGTPQESTVETFTWNVVAPNQVPAALVKITENSNKGWNDTSTYGNNSFQITNTGDVNIESILFDVTNTFMPDVVFDPSGTGGDTAGRCFTPNNGASAVGVVTDGNNCDMPYPFNLPNDTAGNYASGNDGYFGLMVDFDDFDSGESFGFAVDMDPNSIKGDNTAGGSGGISGLEMIGGTVTVEFADGTVITAPIWMGDAQNDVGGQAVIALGAPTETPSIDVVGLNTPAVTSQKTQNIAVTGPAGAEFTLLQVDSRLEIDSGYTNTYDDSQPGFAPEGYDIEPFEANESIGKSIYTGSLDASGQASCCGRTIAIRTV